MRNKKILAVALAGLMAVSAMYMPNVNSTVAYAEDVSGDFVIEDGVLKEYKGDGGGVVIPEGVKAIGYQAFSDCTGLTDISIPAGVTSIGYEAFYNCSNLTNITIPGSVTDIGEWAFGKCENITSITIPNSITSIEDHAFADCSSLTNITIPDSISDIGWDSFRDTQWLKDRQAENPLVIVNGILIDGTTCSGDVVIPDGVTSINYSAFSGCRSLTSTANIN